MADEPTNTTNPEVGEADAQGAASTAEGDAKGGAKKVTAEELLADNAKLRDQRRALRAEVEATKGSLAELETLREFKKTAELEKMTESQRLQAERDEATQKLADLQRRTLDLAVTNAVISEFAVSGQRLRDPDIALQTLRSKYADKLKLEGETVSGAKEAVAAFVEAYPWMLDTGATITGLPGQAPPKKGDDNLELTDNQWRDLASNNPDEYRRLRMLKLKTPVS